MAGLAFIPAITRPIAPSPTPLNQIYCGSKTGKNPLTFVAPCGLTETNQQVFAIPVSTRHREVWLFFGLTTRAPDLPCAFLDR